MTTDVLLINGISLPYPLLDKGVECTQKEGSFLHVVFIYRNNKKTYQASKDKVLSIPDFNERKAEQNLETLIRTNMQYTQSFFRRNHIEIEIVILPNPTLEDVVQKVEKAHRVYVDKASFDHPKDFAFVDFLYTQLEERLSSRLEPVSVTQKLNIGHQNF